MKYSSKKKKVLVGALVACVAAIMAAGSLAYYTAQDTVINTFSVTDARTPGEPEVEAGLFSIDLYEESDATPQGTDADNNGKLEGDEITGYDYGVVEAGESYKKEPYVTNTSEAEHDAWIRVTATVSNYSYVTKGFGTSDSLDDLFTVGTGWTVGTAEADKTIDKDNDTGIVVFYLNAALAQDATTATPAFTQVTMPDDLAKDADNDFEGFTITVKADAISKTDMDAEVKDTDNTTPKCDTAQEAFAYMAANSATSS